jgi:hypothetical protein
MASPPQSFRSGRSIRRTPKLIQQLLACSTRAIWTEMREAIGSALPKPRKKAERPRFKLMAAVPFIDAILEADRKAPRKQRHTVRRIWQRIQEELAGCQICQRTVRQYVHDRKRALGLLERKTYVPQSYDWGVEPQVDWYEAYADLGGERVSDLGPRPQCRRRITH